MATLLLEQYVINLGEYKMVEPIRILQVFGEMNRGGAETMIMNLYRNIDRYKVQFDFIVHTTEKCAFDDEIEELGGKIYRIIRYNGKNHFAYKKEWNNFFLEHQEYKIIHGHIRSTATIYLRIAKNYGKVTVAHSHSIVSRGNKIQRIIKGILQYPIRNISDYYFACSIEAGNWLFGKNIVNNNNFVVLKNAIDLDLFQYNEKTRLESRNSLNLSDEFLVGHVGSFTEVKNHEFLLDIFLEIKKINKNSKLLLVGDGILKNKIKDKAIKLGIETSVLFYGTSSETEKLYNAMDVFVFPSMYEGLGVALIEAQSTGLRCYTTKGRVPIETKVTDLINYVPLNYSAKEWADVILGNEHNIRVDKTKEVKLRGYDIKDTSKWVEKFYLESIRGGRI